MKPYFNIYKHIFNENSYNQFMNSGTLGEVTDKIEKEIGKELPSKTKNYIWNAMTHSDSIDLAIQYISEIQGGKTLYKKSKTFAELYDLIYAEYKRVYKKSYNPITRLSMNEKITLPISINSVILYGKFLNKKAIVKSFGKNDKGQPTIITDKGKEIPLLKVRLPNLIPKEKEEQKTYKKLFKEEYDFHCLMLKLNNDFVLRNIRLFQSKIKPEDIYNDKSNNFGLELKPHITIIYGLKNEDDYDDLQNYFRSKPEVKFTIGEVSLFENENYDVLVLDVISNDLIKYNSYVKDNFDCEITFDTYKPHITIAYLKKGLGKKYLNFESDLTDEIFREEDIIYSLADGRKLQIELEDE